MTNRTDDNSQRAYIFVVDDKTSDVPILSKKSNNSGRETIEHYTGVFVFTAHHGLIMVLVILLFVLIHRFYPTRVLLLFTKKKIYPVEYV